MRKVSSSKQGLDLCLHELRIAMSDEVLGWVVEFKVDIVNRERSRAKFKYYGYSSYSETYIEPRGGDTSYLDMVDAICLRFDSLGFKYKIYIAEKRYLIVCEARNAKL